MSSSKNRHTFPWGIYIGDLMDNGNRLPLYLPSHLGGFNVIFDDASEIDANNFIENIALKLFEVLPVGDIKVDVFDFSYKKRFTDLSLLKDENLYEISLTCDEANSKFSELEKTSLYRHHNLLSSKINTISQYNQVNNTIEKYRLLLINLDHYPDDLPEECDNIKEFFNSAYEIGFYTIAFGSRKALNSKKKSTQYLIDKFSLLEFKNKKIVFTKELFEFYDLTQQYDFKYMNDDKNTIVEKILKSLQTQDPVNTEESIK